VLRFMLCCSQLEIFNNFLNKGLHIFIFHWDLKIVQCAPPSGHQKGEVPSEVFGPKGQAVRGAVKASPGPSKGSLKWAKKTLTGGRNTQIYCAWGITGDRSTVTQWESATFIPFFIFIRTEKWGAGKGGTSLCKLVMQAKSPSEEWMKIVKVWWWLLVSLMVNLSWLFD
jgi:hypothetical protein